MQALFSDLTLENIQKLWAEIALFLFAVFILNKTPLFREVLGKTVLTVRERLLLILTFSLLGIGGAYCNIPLPEGIVNFRAVGPITAGFLCGPLVGGSVGIIVGICRVLLFSTYADELHGLITILQGIAAGLLSERVKSKRHIALRSFLFATLIECGSALFFYISIAGNEYIPDTILRILIPNILANPIAVFLFVSVLEDSLKQRENIRLVTARGAYETFSLVLSSLASGFNGWNMRLITDIIMRSLAGLSGVLFVSGATVSANISPDEEHAAYCRHVLRKFLPAGSAPPDVPSNITLISVRNHSGETAQLAVVKPPGTRFSAFEKEFLGSVRHMLEAVTEFERLRCSDRMLAESEIRMLQAQINPHFLFNTLNTISYYCRSDPDTATELIACLSDYYRYSLKRPNLPVPLSEEIANIRAFIDLEKARFSDRLTVSFRLPKETPLRIPPLILQPLVENAVRHGLLPLARGGTVIVGLIEHPEFYKLYVADNGAGIPKEKNATLLCDTEQRDSIGLINVHHRLLNLYGPESGLHITSREGRGTIVSFKLRKEREMP